MNEQIEKLALGCYQAPEFDYKKFAELIAKECMAKCAAIEKHFQDNEAPGIGLEFGAERSVANSCRASIADHFGVNLD